MSQRSQILQSQQARLTTPQPDVKSLLVLSAQQYKAFEASFPIPDTRTITDPVQAGIQLGIQLALQKLRTGFVQGM